VLIAASLSIAVAAVCGWLTLCLLFWQGSWQLLYQPAAAVARNPASVSIAFEPIAFAATEAGDPRLRGWWIPAAPDAQYARYTVLYLHGQSGNLSNAVDALASLHSVGVNVLAFDYRGYGQSQFARPSEARWREDAEWALAYLTATRHVPPGAIVLDGTELGANLALEVAASHPELAGVVLESPLASPADALFNDPRARMVPARLLVRDRFDPRPASAALRIPSLWTMAAPAAQASTDQRPGPPGYAQDRANKMLVWLDPSAREPRAFAESYSRWLDDLPAK
jgi:pimeloyl-ACP methyl ester carboxylesterase